MITPKQIGPTVNNALGNLFKGMKPPALLCSAPEVKDALERQANRS